jgi:hypothetical protein
MGATVRAVCQVYVLIFVVLFLSSKAQAVTFEVYINGAAKERWTELRETVIATTTLDWGYTSLWLPAGVSEFKLSVLAYQGGTTATATIREQSSTTNVASVTCTSSSLVSCSESETINLSPGKSYVWRLELQNTVDNNGDGKPDEVPFGHAELSYYLTVEREATVNGTCHFTAQAADTQETDIGRCQVVFGHIYGGPLSDHSYRATTSRATINMRFSDSGTQVTTSETSTLLVTWTPHPLVIDFGQVSIGETKELTVQFKADTCESGTRHCGLRYTWEEPEWWRIYGQKSAGPFFLPGETAWNLPSRESQTVELKVSFTPMELGEQHVVLHEYRVWKSAVHDPLEIKVVGTGVSPPLIPLKVVGANLNHHSWSDVVEIASVGNKLALRTHLSDGVGGFATSDWYETGDIYKEGSRFVDVVVADVNGDGIDDLIHVRTDSERLIFRVHISNGDGGFTSFPWYRTGDVDCISACFVQVVVADVNGDGRQDLVHVRTKNNRLIWRVHLVNSSGGFSPQPWYQTGDQYCADACFAQVVVADVNGDGRQDLIHVRTDSQYLLWRVHLANSPDGFIPQPWYRTGDRYAEDTARVGIFAVHLDNNKQGDVAHWRTDEGKIIVRSYLADLNGSFTGTLQWYRTGDLFAEDASRYGLLSADMNGDRLADLLHWRTDGGSLIFKAHFADGAGGYQSGSWYHTP